MRSITFKAWVLGPVLCKLVLYVQIVTLASTTFILTAMSVDRYLAICHPLQRTCKPKVMIAVSWLAALVFATPQLFIFKQVSNTLPKLPSLAPCVIVTHNCRIKDLCGYPVPN